MIDGYGPLGAPPYDELERFVLKDKRRRTAREMRETCKLTTACWHGRTFFDEAGWATMFRSDL